MITQKGWVITVKGIACCTKGKKVYLNINPYTKTIEELENPVASTFIANTCELRRKLRIARVWYCNIHVQPITVTISLPKSQD